VDRVSIEAVDADPIEVIAQAAYLELSEFEAMSRAAAAAPNLAAKEVLSTAAGLVLAKHKALTAELRRRGSEPSEAMAPFR